MQIETVKIFLAEVFCDLNIRNNLNHTALFYAMHQGHLEIVQILLEYGAQPNSIGEEELIELSSIDSPKQSQIMKMLLDKDIKHKILGIYGNVIK